MKVKPSNLVFKGSIGEKNEKGVLDLFDVCASFGDWFE